MAKCIPVDVFDLVIFGGAADLTLRKLMPALYHRDGDGQLPPGCRILSIGRSEMSRDAFLGEVEQSLRANLAETEFSDELWPNFSGRLRYIRADAPHARPESAPARRPCGPDRPPACFCLSGPCACRC